MAKWYYFELVGAEVGFPVGPDKLTGRFEALKLTYGLGGSNRLMPGIGVGVTVADGWSCGPSAMESYGLFTPELRFLLPLSDPDTTIMAGKVGYFSSLSFVATGNAWGMKGSKHYALYAALHLFAITGLEVGYLLIGPSGSPVVGTLYAAARLAVGVPFTSAEDVRSSRMPPPLAPTPARRKSVAAAEQFRLPALDGRNSVSSRPVLPTRTVFYFWTPLDARTKEDMKTLDRLARQTRSDLLRVIGVLAYPDDTVEARRFVAGAGISFENAIAERDFLRRLDVKPPAVVVYDQDWTITHKAETYLDAVILRHIEHATKPPPPPEETVYVSDLQPAEVEQCELEKDAFRGRPIVICGTTYRRGLHTHAPARLRWKLNGRYKRFESDIGLWDAGNPRRGVPGDFAGGRGSVIFQVWLDGKKVYDSGVMDWDDRKTVSVSVEGAQQMDLIVETVENNYWDWSVWGGARLVKQ